MKTEMKLIKVTHQQCRLEFFKKQLDKATNSMNYHVKRKHHPYICAEKGEIVSFYEWAVKIAKEQVWIPVTERLPDSQSDVLVVAFWHEKWQTMIGWHSDIGEKWRVITPHGEREPGCVTHWMPLPEQPEEQE